LGVPSTIAIDGPAASGKTTVGRALAERLGYLLFDTGVMYRAATLAALRAGLDPANEGEVTAVAETVTIDVRPPDESDGRLYTVLLDGEDVTWAIRAAEVDANVSQVSAYRGVREAMTRQQRRIGERGRVVMLGRDIGTVVLPEAGVKIYLDATPEERAWRRWRELRARGGDESYEEILEAMRRRDRIDSTRELAPLRPAADAIVIDTTEMDLPSVVQAVYSYVASAKERGTP
jgi:cytidylate kinase